MKGSKRQFSFAFLGGGRGRNTRQRCSGTTDAGSGEVILEGLDSLLLSRQNCMSLGHGGDEAAVHRCCGGDLHALGVASEGLPWGAMVA